MKYAIPEISWHNRDPVLSADFQPKRTSGEPLRLATGGTDSHVVIWYISTSESGSVTLEVASDLTRHQKAVNAVRWSPSGEFLASGDDEAIIFVWKQKMEEPVPVEGEEQYKETWVIHKTLRGHMEDVLDLTWSQNSLQLASGSVDNKVLLWDLNKGKYSCILADHKGFVQGVAWDPQGTLLATASSDRVFRTFDVNTKKVISRSSKAALPSSTLPGGGGLARLFHDDTLQTYFRRLSFSPDGMLIAVPAGRLEPEGKVDAKPINAVLIYTRHSLKTPACVIPCGDPALVTRWSPICYTPRSSGPQPSISSRRMVLAVGTKRSVLIYDTQQKSPVALVNNIHYTRLTDLAWSPDGEALVASSTDGFCSVISFSRGELGQQLPATAPAPALGQQLPATAPAPALGQQLPATAPVPAPDRTAEPMEVQEDTPKESSKEKDEAKTTPPKPEPKSTTPKIDSYMKFKTPTGKNEKSPTKKQKTKKQQKTPVKIDLLVETAMPSWSDNSNSDVVKHKDTEQKPIEIMEIEDSEDIKLVYEDTCKSESPKDEDKPPLKKAKSGSEETKDKDKTEANTDKSPQMKKESPKKAGTPEHSFFKQAKVTDVGQPAATALPSPKAPRRVNFVTLSSPKNKKKC